MRNWNVKGLQWKKFRDHHVRKGEGGIENTTGGSAVLYQWQAYFTPLSTMHTSGAVLEHSDCVQSRLQSTNKTKI